MSNSVSLVSHITRPCSGKTRRPSRWSVPIIPRLPEKKGKANCNPTK